MGAEVHHLITGGLKGRSQAHFHLKPTMIRSNANTHHCSSTLSDFSFYVPSGFHFQPQISGMFSPPGIESR